MGSESPQTSTTSLQVLASTPVVIKRDVVAMTG
jgi:hypothetical protein